MTKRKLGFQDRWMFNRVLCEKDVCRKILRAALGIEAGEISYLNAEQCKLMLGWLEWRLTEPINPRLETIYRKLVEFANKAIELGTGIVFDL